MPFQFMFFFFFLTHSLHSHFAIYIYIFFYLISLCCNDNIIIIFSRSYELIFIVFFEDHNLCNTTFLIVLIKLYNHGIVFFIILIHYVIVVSCVRLGRSYKLISETKKCHFLLVDNNDESYQ